MSYFALGAGFGTYCSCPKTMIRVQISGLTSIPEIKPGDNLTEIIVDCAQGEMGTIQEKDILIVTSKIVSETSGNMVVLDGVKPGKKALAVAKKDRGLCLDHPV